MSAFATFGGVALCLFVVAFYCAMRLLLSIRVFPVMIVLTSIGWVYLTVITSTYKKSLDLKLYLMFLINIS